MKSNINSVEVDSQLSCNRHPVDGALVGAGSQWPAPRASEPGCVPSFSFCCVVVRSFVGTASGDSTGKTWETGKQTGTELCGANRIGLDYYGQV